MKTPQKGVVVLVEIVNKKWEDDRWVYEVKTVQDGTMTAGVSEDLLDDAG